MRTKVKKWTALIALGLAGLLALALLVSPNEDPAFQLGYAGLSQFDSNSVIITLTNHSPILAKFHVLTETPGPFFNKRRFATEGDVFPSNTYAFHVAWPSTNEWRLSGYYFADRTEAWRKPLVAFCGKMGLNKIQMRLMCDPKRIEMIGLEMVGAHPRPAGHSP